MVQLMLRMRAKPGSSEEMVVAAQSLLRPLLQTSGCVRHELYRDAHSPDDICYLEEWGNAEELYEEIRSSRFTRLLALMEHAAEAPRFEIRYVDQSRGLDLVAELRGRSFSAEGEVVARTTPVTTRRRAGAHRGRSARTPRS